MRRGFSIFLILFFGLGPLSSFLGSEDAHLPACCRRHGAHHCAMAARMAAMMREAAHGKMPQVETPATCPQYPGTSVFFSASGPALTVAMAGLPQLRDEVRLGLADYAAPGLIRTRTHAGRGPPFQFL